MPSRRKPSSQDRALVAGDASATADQATPPVTPQPDTVGGSSPPNPTAEDPAAPNVNTAPTDAQDPAPSVSTASSAAPIGTTAPLARPPMAPVGELLDAHEPLLAPSTEYELPPAAMLEPDAGGDTSFVPNLDASVREFGAPRALARVCEWCNAPLPDQVGTTCPTCGANLTPVEPDLEVPGLTTMTMEAQLARQRAETRRQGGSAALSSTLLGANPLLPVAQGAASDDPEVVDDVKLPDEKVRQMMLELELQSLRSELESEARAQAVDEAFDEEARSPEGPPASDEPPSSMEGPPA